MQEYLKSLNPLSNNLIYGQKYSLYLKNKYIGCATWVKDDNVGDSFQIKDNKGISRVYLPDRWELVD